MNRFKLMQNLQGVQAQLKEAIANVDALYENTQSTIKEREMAEAKVADLKNRVEKFQNDLKIMDQEAEKNLKSSSQNLSKEERVINAKASLVKAVMAKEKVSREVLNALGDDATLGNGDKILPSTMTNDLLYEPLAKNPLRGISTFTNITNLEVPKITFSLGDDDFIGDGETAKELAAEAETIVFNRNKFKVFCDITETILNGTNTNLVSVVNAGLQAGLAKKEKKVAFEPKASATPMSFYYSSNSTDYDIKVVQEATLYAAIVGALADLEDDYAANAKIVMRKADYFAMIKELANGNASLYSAAPEQILGAPVVFCDLATVPVVGDFSFSHFNYDLNMIYDRDKNVKTGLESFVLTAWIDHKIKMKSAFRLAVTP